MDLWLTCATNHPPVTITIAVSVDDRGRVTKAPPIASRFVGQPIVSLERWMAGFGGFRKVVLQENR